jgi:hypothetical protein
MKFNHIAKSRELGELAKETREGDEKEELPRPTMDGRLGLERRRLVARRKGERVLGLEDKRDLYSKTIKPKRRVLVSISYI